MIKTSLFQTMESLATAVEDVLRTTLNSSGAMMLSGGSTPYTIYNKMAQVPCPVHSDRTLFLSDERMTPFDSDQNNAHNLEPMLNALQCQNRFIRVDTSLPIHEAALAFAAELDPIQTVDLGLLGMGSDGHTAGFFSSEQANLKNGALTLHTDRPDGLQGVSVTPAFLTRVERIILLVTGESKRKIIHTLMNAPETIPAGIALADHPNAELWTDIQL